MSSSLNDKIEKLKSDIAKKEKMISDASVNMCVENRDKSEKDFFLRQMKSLQKGIDYDYVEYEQLVNQRSYLERKKPYDHERKQGGASRTPRNALSLLTREIQDFTDCDRFYVNNVELNLHKRDLESQLSSHLAKQTKIDEVAKIMELELNTKNCSSIPDIDFKELEKMDEEEFQRKHLNKFLEHHNGIDTHSQKAKNNCTFLGDRFPYRKPQDGNYTSLSNKAFPNGICLTSPQSIEIKSRKSGKSNKKSTGSASTSMSSTTSTTVASTTTRNNERELKVLKQAVERVRIQMYMYAFLSKSICYAFTGNKAFVVIAKRLDAIDVPLEGFICTIDHKDFTLLWDSFSFKSTKEHDFYYISGGRMLMEAINLSLKKSPWDVITKTYHKSSLSAVYMVIEISTDRKTVKTNEPILLAIKVITNEDYKEVEIAQKIFPQIETSYPQPFYAKMLIKGNRILWTRKEGSTLSVQVPEQSNAKKRKDRSSSSSSSNTECLRQKQKKKKQEDMPISMNNMITTNSDPIQDGSQDSFHPDYSEEEEDDDDDDDDNEGSKNEDNIILYWDSKPFYQKDAHNDFCEEAIIMEPGSNPIQDYQFNGSGAELTNMWFQIFQCLEAIHDADFVHSDIRFPNIIQLNSHHASNSTPIYQLIDFGFAMKSNTLTEFTDGDRLDEAKILIPHLNTSHRHKWTTHYDIRMLIAMLGKITTSQQ